MDRLAWGGQTRDTWISLRERGHSAFLVQWTPVPTNSVGRNKNVPISISIAWGTETMRQSRRTLLIVCVGVVVGLPVILFPLGVAGKLWFMSKVLRGTASTLLEMKAQGREHVRITWLADALPSSATDIHYSIRIYGRAEASFRLEEESFWEWAKANGWDPKPMDDRFETEAWRNGSHVRLTIENSYYWRKLTPKTGNPDLLGTWVAVTYDEDKGMVYYEYATGD